MTLRFPIPDLPRVIAALTLAALLSAPSALASQSGEEVLRTLLERYEERMAGVENYTVVQEAMGFSSSTYFERTEVDGHSVFVPRAHEGSEAARRAPTSPYGEMFRIAERATLEGTQDVEGESCYVVSVADLEGTELFGGGAPGEDGSFQPESATFLIDQDDYLLRRMVVRGTSTVEGEPRDVSFTADMRDYREVEGVVHPFRMDVSVEGMAPPMSEEEQARLRESMEEMRAQMDEMPEGQRQMMERMMGGQMEKIEKMLASGAMDVTVQVTEIRVNEGPPEGS